MSGESSTPVRRAPRWPAVRRDWYREAGRAEIAEQTQLPRWALSIGAPVLFWQAVERLPAPLGWALLLSAVLAGVLAWGLFTCHLWAARITGWFAAAMALAGIVGIATGFGRLGWLQLSHGVLVVVAWGYVAADMLSPSARELFRKARVGPPDDAPPA